MSDPLVTIICISFNHEDFVENAIQSVLDQTYQNIELIVVDNGSSDQSVEKIEKIIKSRSIAFIRNQENLGICRAFNQAFYASKGNFLIDLAADDMLHPERVEQGVNRFETVSEEYGVNFTNAELIDDNGNHLGYHFPINDQGNAIRKVKECDLFETLLGWFYLSAPTMLIKRKVLEQLNGYDEGLTYEDFDFWVRSSRDFFYCYSDQVLVKRRIREGSFSNQQTMPQNHHLGSTYRVCQKARDLCTTPAERKAFQSRIRYEARQCLRLKDRNHFSNYLAWIREDSQLQWALYKLLYTMKASWI